MSGKNVTIFDELPEVGLVGFIYIVDNVQWTWDIDLNDGDGGWVEGDGAGTGSAEETETESEVDYNRELIKKLVAALVNASIPITDDELLNLL